LPDFEELEEDAAGAGAGGATWAGSAAAGWLSTAKCGASTCREGGLNPSNRGAGVAGCSTAVVANSRGQSRLTGAGFGAEGEEEDARLPP
jgi:hypothetical protein